MIIINYYLIIINIIELIQMGIDKLSAIKNKNRISERHLIITAFIGGSIGAILGMHIFRHKTKKLKFHFHFILFLSIHTILYLYIKKSLI